MTATNELFGVLVWPLQRKQRTGITVYLPRGCLVMFTLRDAIIPLVRS